MDDDEDDAERVASQRSDCWQWCKSWGDTACKTKRTQCGGCDFCQTSVEQVAVDDTSGRRQCAPFLTADNNALKLGEKNIFLNGMNLAWIRWGHDFLNAGPTGATFYCGVENAMRDLRANGGNALRVWLFTEPEAYFVWREHKVERIVDGVLLMARTLLELAAHYDVFIVLVLFNGAVVRGKSACSIFLETDVLESVVQNVIRPLALELRGYEHLAMWEVINEPEGLLKAPEDNPEDLCMGSHKALVDCPHETNPSGWNQQCLMETKVLQRFVNHISAALHRWDPNHLVTLGSWSFCSSSSGAGYGSRNLFASECLRKAGGESLGKIDVWQIHSYPKEQGGTAFHPADPLFMMPKTYKFDGPVFIGETSNRWVAHPQAGLTSGTASTTMGFLHATARDKGYAGVFSWAFTCHPDVDGGCAVKSDLTLGLKMAADEVPLIELDFAHIRNYHACDCTAELPALVRGSTCLELAETGRCGDPNIASACPGVCTNCGEKLSDQLPQRQCGVPIYPPPVPSPRPRPPPNRKPPPPPPSKAHQWVSPSIKPPLRAALPVPILPPFMPPLSLPSGPQSYHLMDESPSMPSLKANRSGQNFTSLLITLESNRVSLAKLKLQRATPTNTTSEDHATTWVLVILLACASVCFIFRRTSSFAHQRRKSSSSSPMRIFSTGLAKLLPMPSYRSDYHRWSKVSTCAEDATENVFGCKRSDLHENKHIEVTKDHSTQGHGSDSDDSCVI